MFDRVLNTPLPTQELANFQDEPEILPKMNFFTGIFKQFYLHFYGSYLTGNSRILSNIEVLLVIAKEVV